MVGKHPWDFYKDREPRPEKHHAYRNEHHLHFADASREWGLGRSAITYGCAYADFDSDGDLDLVEVNLDEPPTLYRNGARGNAVTFRFKGRGGNTAAYGTRVEIRTAAGSQFRGLFPQSGYHSLNEAMVHFGLGEETVASSVMVTWPDGQVEYPGSVRAGYSYTLTQPSPAAVPAAAPVSPAAHFTKAQAFPPSVIRRKRMTIMRIKSCCRIPCPSRARPGMGGCEWRRTRRPLCGRRGGPAG